tara:strand:- start:446 stop:913 length:468 start_codon:yes stop_codon:yes gene_type:complete
MSGIDAIENIKSKFSETVGGNEGIVSPQYDIQTVPIVIQNTEKGFLVHESVGIIGRFSGEGTGEVASDAIKYYSNEDFKQDIGNNFVTLDTYVKDMKGMEAGSVANDKFLLVNDLTIMRDRLQEVGRDMTAYQDNVAEQIQDLQQRVGQSSLECN